MSFTPGQTLGNYRILGRIGIGGMGEVYLAEHPLIGKKVALKVIHRELSKSREVVLRFFTEARACNQIGNDHIVEIHDFGQTDEGIHFFIMEYLDGTTLADELERGGVLAVPRVLHIGAQLADALGAAHAAGIIHRDLKPDNVMLVTKFGAPDFVKVLDFGLAKIFAEASGQKLTAVGVLLGTPQYMSPEAAESRPGIDHRTDIYSLGVLLFQLLCGRVPFLGDSMGEILVKQVTHPPPAPRGINPAVPPAVEQILLRCLAKVPGSRFQTMGELRDALLDPQRYLASSPPIMPTAAPDHRTMLEAPRHDPPRHHGGGPPIHPPVGPAPGQHPGLARPAPVTNRTMAISTPAGHSGIASRRRRRFAAIVVLASLTGGGIAFIKNVEQELDADATSADRIARIRVATIPPGAEVVAADGRGLGTTPVQLELPVDGRPVTLTLRHPAARPQAKTFVPKVDESFEIELEPLAAPGPADAGPARDAGGAGVVGGTGSTGQVPVAGATPTPAATPDAGAVRPPRPKRASPGGGRPRRPTRRVGNGTLPPDF